MKVLAREIPLFVLVGLAATACNYVGALAAQRLWGAGPLFAGCAGYLSAVGISYLGNSHLTFRRPVLHGPQFARFAVISLRGACRGSADGIFHSRLFDDAAMAVGDEVGKVLHVLGVFGCGRFGERGADGC